MTPKQQPIKKTKLPQVSDPNMKVVILAGGYGTRISEETGIRPKPMVEIGGQPILWHIMQLYSAYGLNNFIICTGYKGQYIKDYFANFYTHQANLTCDLKNNTVRPQIQQPLPWKVTVVDTGMDTMTGGRLLRVKDLIGKENFCLTYGDGLGDINITKLIEFHQQQKCYATLTTVRPPQNFGVLTLDQSKQRVKKFIEKPKENGVWINGGFFVLHPKIFEYLADDKTILEKGPLNKLVRQGQLAAYRHSGYWRAMDTLQDKHKLESRWQTGKAPWKIW